MSFPREQEFPDFQTWKVSSECQRDDKRASLQAFSAAGNGLGCIRIQIGVLDVKCGTDIFFLI